MIDKELVQDSLRKHLKYNRQDLVLYKALLAGLPTNSDKIVSYKAIILSLIRQIKSIKSTLKALS